MGREVGGAESHLLTWVHLTVAADSIGIHDALETRGELVGLVIGGWGLLGLHPIEDRRHIGAALLLNVTQNDDLILGFSFTDMNYEDISGQGSIFPICQVKEFRGSLSLYSLPEVQQRHSREE